MQEMNLFEKWQNSVGENRLQNFQKAFADFYGFGLCFRSIDGILMTSGSNLPKCCYNISFDKANSACSGSCLSAKENLDNPVLFTCSCGVRYAICPIINEGRLVAYGVVYETSYKAETQEETSTQYTLSEAKMDYVCNLLISALEFFSIEYNRCHTRDYKNESNCAIQLYKKLLTEREREVAKLICDGMTNKDIGDILCISEKTVKTHVSNILSKMKFKDRIQLIVNCSSFFNNYEDKSPFSEMHISE